MSSPSLPNVELVFAKAAALVARQGRPLERARWRVGFENAPAVEALAVLAAYQNPDGGFGHALEPDFWNPDSSPIQTWVAMEVLREVGFTDVGHPVVQRLLAWLEAQFAAATGLPSVVAGNNDSPHAPWWSFEVGAAQSNHSEWNPQAALAGFAWSRAAPGSRLESLAASALGRAVADFAANGSAFDPHVVACFVTLADEVGTSGRAAPFDLDPLNLQLNRAAETLVEPNPDKWFTEYCCRPSQLIRVPGPRWSPRLQDLAREEARSLLAAQDVEGSWPVTWSWGAYPEAWPVARAWWRGILALQNCRFIRGWAP